MTEMQVAEKCSLAQVDQIKEAMSHEIHGRRLFGNFLIGALTVANPKLLAEIAERYLSAERTLLNNDE